MDIEAEAKVAAVKAKVEAKEEVVTQPVAEPVKPALPGKIKMVKMWGFIDKAGHNHLWQAGQVVESAEEIQMIVDCKFTAFTVVS